MPEEIATGERTDPRWKRAARGCVLLAGALTAAASLAGRAGQAWWVLELASHWRMQYLVAFVLVTLGCLLFRAWKWGALFGVVAAVELLLVLPLYIPPERSGVEGRTWRLATINTWAYGDSEDRVISAIRELDPDIVVLVEISADLLARGRAIREAYPWQLARPDHLTGDQKESFGIALLSRVPVLDAGFFSPAQTGVTALKAELDLDGRRVRLVATHLYPPVTAHWAEMRNAQIEDLAGLFAGERGPALLCGDLNLTPWSPWFDRLTREGRLTDSALGFGVQPTWPARFPPLGIPIDHCLHTPGLVVTDRFTGPRTGSDHLPLVVEFGVAK